MFRTHHYGRLGGVTVIPARHISGHFGDESFQTITCTGTDKWQLKTGNRKYTKNSK